MLTLNTVILDLPIQRFTEPGWLQNPHMRNPVANDGKYLIDVRNVAAHDKPTALKTLDDGLLW